MDDLSGQSIKGYTIQERIGGGGFGDVYRANQPTLKRDVAIKIIKPEFAGTEEFVKRFEIEAELLARLEHPRIVPLYDYWHNSDGAFLVMRWIKGGSLRDLLERDGPLTVDNAVHIVKQIGEALGILHENDVVHRDLKPDNILMDEDGNAYVTDFGIVKVIGSTAKITQDGRVMGTFAYLSPEQILASTITPHADIYSFGVMLYEILTGSNPFAGEEIHTTIYKHLHEELPSVRQFRPEWSDYMVQEIDEIIHKATSKNKDTRFDDIHEMISELQRRTVRVKRAEDTKTSLDHLVGRISQMRLSVSSASEFCYLSLLLLPDWGNEDYYERSPPILEHLAGISQRRKVLHKTLSELTMNDREKEESAYEELRCLAMLEQLFRLIIRVRVDDPVTGWSTGVRLRFLHSMWIIFSETAIYSIQDAVNTPTRKNPVCIYNGKLEIREIPDNWQSLEFIELFGQEDSVELMFLCSVEFFREPLEFFAENATQHYSLMYTWPSATERRIMGVPLFILYDKSESLWRE